MPGMSPSIGSKDSKVFEDQIGHGIVTEDGQARIDTAITDTRAAKPGAAFSCTATEYINEIDQHRPQNTPQRSATCGTTPLAQPHQDTGGQHHAFAANSDELGNRW
jgi:hypothetical protein